MTASTGGMWDMGEDVDYWFSCHLAAFIYGMPMEVFIHAAASGMVRAWVDEDNDTLIHCDDMVALLGNPRYHHWS